MARPLREQFVVATLVLLIPVAGVMTWAARTTYAEQLTQLRQDADLLAQTIATMMAPVDRPLDDYERYIRAIDLLPDNATILITNREDGTSITTGPPPAMETRSGAADVAGTSWTVSVSLPTLAAWTQASESYKRIIAISGIATLMLLAIEAVFLSRWLRSFRTLEHHALRIGSGDYTMPEREPMPARELEQMRDTFTTMVGRLREAHENIARQVEEERRMRREVESLQQQVIRQERLAAIGVLLSGIAHELNNPLQAISGLAQLLQRENHLSGALKDDLALIQKESARASAIIRNLSRFSRQQGARPTRVYLRDVVASVVELRQHRLHERGVVLEIDDEAVEPVTAVLTELQQVVLNFVINAEHAIATAKHDDGRIAIRTRDVGARVRLEVEDNGPGVPAEDESKLFQPFFTTKPVGEGTGLGLSVSYGVIQGYGGSIGYERARSGGALFYFELPARDAGAHGTGTTDDTPT